MRLLHTSDWHLGITLSGGTYIRTEQKKMIEEIGRIATAKKVDGILLAGDVFDKSIASQDAIQIYDEAMTYICATLNIPIYMIAGNHDGAERLAQCSELLKKSGLFIAGSLKAEPQVIRGAVDGTDSPVDIYLLPWISTDKVRTVFPDKAEEVTSMEAAYKIVLDEYRDSFIEGHKNILVSHAFIVDAQTSVSDRAAEVGRATMVGSFVFEGFDYVALGHLHGPQKINDSIRYSGTPLCYSFGREEAQEKLVVIIDTETGEQEIVPVPQPYRMLTLKGTYNELMGKEVSEEEKASYIRLEVADSFIGLSDITAFRDRYPHALEFNGKSLDRGDVKSTMTVDELENIKDPGELFMRYCQDMMGESPDEHLMGLFESALKQYEAEV